MATIIACCGQKGGTGKSVIARALATELTRRRMATVLIDLDVGQRTATEWAQARAHNKIQPTVHVETVDTDEESDFRIPELSATADYIVCDAPGWSDEITLQLAQAADLIVLPSGTATDDMRPAIRLFHELIAAGINRNQILIVLNRAQTEAQVREAADYLTDLIIVHEALPYQRAYERASSVGQSVTEVAGGPGEKAKAIVDAIIKQADRSASTAQKTAPRRFELEDGESWS